MTFHVERIDHVVLRVRDLDGMVRFYEQALGFKVERTLERLSLVQMRAGASMLDLVKGERKHMKEIAVLTFENGLISSLREYLASERLA